MPSLKRRSFLSTSLAAIAFPPGDSPHLGIIDTHTHFFDPTRPQGVPWPGKQDPTLYRKVMPEEFKRLAKPLGVVATIIVEASPWVEDNQWLLDLCNNDPFIPGIIGNLNPLEEKFPDHLHRFSKNHKFLGFRINDNALKSAMEDPNGMKNLSLLSDLGLRLEVNGGPPLLTTVNKLAGRLKNLKIMINHAANLPNDGKPPAKAWVDGMKAASLHKNVFCKVSALLESARHGGNKEKEIPLEYFQGVLNVLWENFGPGKLVCGSNWPVSDKAGSLKEVFQIVKTFGGTKSVKDQERLFSGTAREFYGLK